MITHQVDLLLRVDSNDRDDLYKAFYKLQLPHAQALQWAWTAGHTAGGLIAFAWPMACLESLPPSLDPTDASWDSLLFLASYLA